ASDPFGEWSEPIWVAQGGIDPSLCFEGDRAYLTSTGQAPDPSDPARRLGVIQQSEIDLASGRLLTEPRPIWSGTGGAHPEGPHLYQIGGRYYLMIAEGGTEYGHMETIVRSDSPWGPWEPCPHNPILTHRSSSEPIQATGHADLVEAADGSWWLVCLGIRPGGPVPAHHLGRETFLAPVSWDADGWPRVGRAGRIALEMEAPRLTPVTWEPTPIRDDFDGPQLAPAWNLMGNPDRTRWSLAERPGWLSLWGNPAALDDGAGVAFVGRRLEHFSCEAATLLDFAPAGAGQEAGLAAWMNPRHYATLVVSAAEGQRWISVRRRIGTLQAVTARQPAPAGPLVMWLRTDRKLITLGFTAPTGEEHVLDTAETRYLATEVAGGFTGVYLALWASGQSASAAPAHFDWFDYCPAETPAALSLDAPVQVIAADEAARSAVERHFPGVLGSATAGWAAAMPLVDLIDIVATQFPAERLQALAGELRQLSRERGERRA
ncbi:MAG: family 43 glycosylhydrolase, partial [Anaerolineales bacterium]|nr:family 43 glycosylhydrolase [Anaerolineales bacterium]